MKTNYLKKWWAVALMMLTMGVVQVSAQALQRAYFSQVSNSMTGISNSGTGTFVTNGNADSSPSPEVDTKICWINSGNSTASRTFTFTTPVPLNLNSDGTSRGKLIVYVAHKGSSAPTFRYNGTAITGMPTNAEKTMKAVEVNIPNNVTSIENFFIQGTNSSNNTRFYAIEILTYPACDNINTSFSVTGNAEICEGSTAPVGLNGSQGGVSYQLYKDGVAEGSPKVGDGAAINFGDFGKGVYTVKGTGTGDFCPAETAMTGSATITEVFCGATYDLTINVSLEGAGNVSGAGTYPQDETVDISATANRGFDFVNWTGATTVADPNAASTTIDLTADVTLTANFVAKTARNLVATPGANVLSATVKNITEAEASNYFDGEIAEFTAEINDNDFAFDGWYNGSTKVSADLITEQTVNGDLTLEARVIERPVLNAKVEVGSITDKTATLSWDEVAGATGYNVELCKSTITTKTLTFPASGTINDKSAAQLTFTIGDITIGSKMLKNSNPTYNLNTNQNGRLYNITPLPGRIKTISFTSSTTDRGTIVYYGNSRIINEESGNYTITSDANSGNKTGSANYSFDVEGDYTYFCFTANGTQDTKISNIVITYEAGGVDCLPIANIAASTTEIDLATEFGALDPETEYTYTVTAIGSIANPSSGDFITNATPANPLKSFGIKWSQATIENGAITFPEGLNTDQTDCMETYFTLADDFTDCTVWLDGKQLVYEQIGEWGEAAWVCYGDIRAFTGTIEVVSPASSAVKGIQKAVGDPLGVGEIIAEYSLDTNSQNVSTDLGADKTNSPEVKDCFNVLGVQVPCESNGIVIKRFTDGSTAKTLNK